jgi:hypothetical protein
MDGTPRRREKRQRGGFIGVRCTPDELAAITAAAARAGMSVGAFMRHQAIGTPGPRAVRRPQVDRAELARVLAALGRYGSNVNQLAHVANSGGIPPLDELTAACAAAMDMRNALMRALGRGD